MSKTFSIGDSVAVLDDTIKGVVTKINNAIITIMTEDEFSLNYDASDLVLIVKDQKEYSKYIDIQHEHLLEKDFSNTKKQSIKHSKNRKIPPMEVDLHIHHLIKSTRGMTNYDMLTLQIDTARKQLEFAIRKKIPRIVFIHGIGEGVLQTELEFLLGRYNVEVSPASFQKYGFGATEVYIYQNSKE